MHHHNINFPVFKIHNMIHVIIINSEVISEVKQISMHPPTWLLMWPRVAEQPESSHCQPSEHTRALLVMIPELCIKPPDHLILCICYFLFLNLHLLIPPPLPKSYMFGFYKHLAYKEIKQCFFSYFMNTMSSKSTLIGGKWYGFLLC